MPGALWLAHAPLPDAVGYLFVQGVSCLREGYAYLADVVRLVRDEIAKEGGRMGLEAFDFATCFDPFCQEKPDRAGGCLQGSVEYLLLLCSLFFYLRYLLRQLRRGGLKPHQADVVDVGEHLAYASAFRAWSGCERVSRDRVEYIETDSAMDVPGVKQLVLHSLLVAAPLPPERGRLLYLAVRLGAYWVAGWHERLFDLGLILVGGACADEVYCFVKLPF